MFLFRNNKMNKHKNKYSISLYWKCQFIGWGIVSVYWAYIVYSRDSYSVFYTFVNYILDILLGVSLTHLYRAFALKFGWSKLPINSLLIRVIPIVLFLAVLYAFLGNVKWYAYWVFVAGEHRDLLTALLYWNPILITGLRLMSIWILAYHLYHYYQKEVKTAKENAQLSIIAKQAQLDNLSAQLNPHFLFNSLNSIKSLVIENPKVARRAIDLLSDLLRSSLYEKDDDLITIKNELALVKDYIELEKLRFEERLNLKLTIEEELNTIKIPTLSIQLLVENAIKHGIDKSIDGGIVCIDISKENEQIFIRVQNPGIMQSYLSSKGVGLKNLKERLQIQYKNTANFTLKQSEKQIVLATITLPLPEDENI